MAEAAETAEDAKTADAAKTAEAPARTIYRQALILKLSAYLAGSLPSQTKPSNSLLLRITSLGTLTFIAEAACLYRSIWLICLATAR